MLEMVGDLNNQQEGYVQKIVVGVESMSRLVNNLLDLGRIEAEIGLRLNQILGAAAHPLYGEWISGYCSDGYQEENSGLIELMNTLAEGRSEEELAYLEEVFINCSRYEAQFWDMAWKMED